MSSYWERRQAEDMFHYMEEAESAADQVAALYRKASRYLSLQADQIFDRYKTNHGLSEVEARQLINTLHDLTSINDLLQRLRNGDKTENKQELLKQLEAPAYQARLERLRQLQNQIDLIMQNVYQQEKDFSTSFYTDLAREAYYRNIFNIQQRAEAAFSFVHVSQKQIDLVLNSRWSGENYSKRIWKNTQALAKDIKEELLINLVTGRTNREAARIIANKFAQGSSNARRLIRTESNFLSCELNFKAYEECGVEEYQYLAILDLRTSKVCRELDGKIFQVKDRKVGTNCPPMHPWCRSTTISVIDRALIAKMKRSAIDPATGKRIKVPRSMNYQEWYDKYVNGTSRTPQKSNTKPIAKTADTGIMELYRKTDDARNSFKFISDETFNNLTISARKKGAVIIRGTREAEEHLERQGAAASNIGDVLIFRKDVCISEVLEETYHFEQNTLKMNNDKTEPLRSILNEIDAKQYLLENADKYKIPRNEIELTKRQLEAYQQQLEEYGKDVK